MISLRRIYESFRSRDEEVRLSNLAFARLLAFIAITATVKYLKFS